MATVCACIDIGTNTTRLLVARHTAEGVQPIAAERAFVALAGDDPETAGELAGVVAAQVRSAHRHGAERVRIVGTAALRARPDARALCTRLEEAAGQPVEILTPEREAGLAFRGATAGLSPGPGDVAVVDVGGGSAEVAVGPVGGEPRWWASVPSGSALLTAEHVHHDPPTPEEIAALRTAAGAAFAGLRIPACDRALAVGGSAASMPRLVGPVVSRAAVERAVTLLVAGPAERVAAALALHPRRVRVLPAGLLLLAAAGDAAGRALDVAGGGLREGLLLEAR